MPRIDVSTPVLKKNDEIALENRSIFESRGTVAVNLMSAPGAGKTTLLEKTLPALQGRFRCGVIEGDLRTDLDAREDDCSDPDMRERMHRDVSGQKDSGGEVYVITDIAIVLDNGGCVYDAVLSDAGVGVDRNSGHDYGSFGQSSGF